MAMKAKGKVRALLDQDLVNALSHPLRGHILDTLNETIASPSDLAREVGADVNYVAYHVKELEKIGYVELVKTEPRRGAVEHFYRASRKFIIDEEEWERLPAVVKDGVSAGFFQCLLEEVKDALEAGTFGARHDHLSRTRLRVDEQGWEALSAMLKEAMERVLEIQAECEKRLEASGEEAIPVSVTMAGFEAARPSPAEPKLPAVG
jgi:DNA-binding transcriptional ArsR family regulator